MLQTGFPRIIGDIGNPQTFSFPIRYRVVEGASVERVVKAADPSLIRPFIEAGRALVDEGCRAITTSCGFLAIFQKELAEAIPVPVFSSALLQAHQARAMLGRGKKIGVLTARQASLTERHLAGVGIADLPLVIAGMDEAREFTSVFIGGKSTLDEAQCRAEMIRAAEGLVKEHPEVGALVLECTNMPPYSDDIRRVTGLPVFDIVTLVRNVRESLEFRT